jgi:hypothetical protein
MSKITKKPRTQPGKPQSAPPVSPPPPLPGHDGEYPAELADWHHDNYGENKDDFFTVFEHAADGMPERLVMTVFVNPAFGAKAEKAIANLIACAPDLWRCLRKLAPSVKSDSEGCAEFAEAEALLWDAAGRQPYDRVIDSADEEVVTDWLKAHRRSK